MAKGMFYQQLDTAVDNKGKNMVNITQFWSGVHVLQKFY